MKGTTSAGEPGVRVDVHGKVGQKKVSGRKSACALLGKVSSATQFSDDALPKLSMGGQEDLYNIAPF